MHYLVQNRVSRPNIDNLRHPTWTYHKGFEKCPKNAKKNIFSPFWFLIKKIDHNSGLHAKNQRDISKNRNVDIPLSCWQILTIIRHGIRNRTAISKYFF